MTAVMRRRNSRGVTLIELMTVVVIVAILAAVGVPSFREFIASQKVKSAASSLQAALLQARSEALKRNTGVTLQPTLGTQWNTGWRIVDPADSSRSLLTSEAISVLTIEGPASVVYLSSGRLGGSAASFSIFTSGSTTARCVSVTLTGMAAVSGTKCS